MRAGSLDKRAAFQAQQAISDGAGGRTKAWVAYQTVWAQFSPERAREQIQQGRLSSRSAGVVRIRTSARMKLVDDTYRVLIDGKVFNIRSALQPSKDMLEFAVETDGTAGAN